MLTREDVWGKDGDERYKIDLASQIGQGVRVRLFIQFQEAIRSRVYGVETPRDLWLYENFEDALAWYNKEIGAS